MAVQVELNTLIVLLHGTNLMPPRVPTNLMPWNGSMGLLKIHFIFKLICCLLGILLEFVIANQLHHVALSAKNIEDPYDCHDAVINVKYLKL